jgi:cysteine desulfurase
MKKVYLDYAATTPVDTVVLKKMLSYLKEKYGNPSSIHKFGQEARDAVGNARDQLAKFLNCSPLEVVFTGSASESDNLAIRGLIKALKQRKRAGEKIHIITSKIEHKAVLETCKDLEKNEKVKITYLLVGQDGLINIDDLEAEITPETDLVSIMYANNEIGVVQPIEKIGQLIAKINKNKEHRIYFHTDAAQAVNWLDCDVEELGLDLLTLSGHKIYGPKGVGALYIREGTPIESMITGGDHEFGLRAGTENVAGIVALGEAISIINEQRTMNSRKIERLREKLVKEVLKIQGSKLNGPARKEDGLPNIANFSFQGVEGESLIIALDQEGVAVSTGSACTSRELRPSHVLTAMGLLELEAHSSLRVSLGKYTTIQEINYFLKVLPKTIERLRKISGH